VTRVRLEEERDVWIGELTPGDVSDPGTHRRRRLQPHDSVLRIVLLGVPPQRERVEDVSGFI
jgi:hypothetical protein